MGGYGSGRPGYKQKAEHCRSIEVNRFKREGCLNPGARGNWVWSRDGEEVARIGYRSTKNYLFLSYRARTCHDDDWHDVKEHIQLLRIPGTYGGVRTFFQCPGVVHGRACERRVGKLFAGGRYFLCRHCYRIAYTSQSEPHYDRMLRRANKLRCELGGEPGTAHCIAPKPKGMWERTYQRKRLEIEWCENQANQLFLSKFQHLHSEDERKLYFET